MVWIPAGGFLRGDVEGTRDANELKTVQNVNDEPFHDTYLDGFWIARHPVTNEEFVRFLQDAMSEGLVRPETAAVMGQFEGEWVPLYHFKSYELILLDFFKRKNARRPFMLNLISWDGEKFRIKAGHERHPVVDVTWFGSTAYANYHGLQLPSEAQWEKAARGTDGRRYPWGMRLPTPYHAPQAPDLALKPVGSFSPEGDSPYGVCETLSGCFEWTSDWYNTEYYEDYYLPEMHRNPCGTFWGRSHAIRGFPNDLMSTVDAVDRPSPISLRYEWIFDHMLGDCFANRQSAFRTALCPSAPLGLISQGGGYRPLTTAEAAAHSAAEGGQHDGQHDGQDDGQDDGQRDVQRNGQDDGQHGGPALSSRR
jgi:formylglycine-generating enzyme required for sulfatase activity